MSKRKLSNKLTVEALYPNRQGRAAGDAAIDEIPSTATIAEALDAFDEAYFRVTGLSPFRPEVPRGTIDK